MAQEYTGWDESDEWAKDEKRQKKEAAALKASTTTDCRSEEGITVGLIDSIITTGRILKQRLLMLQATPAVEEALKHLRNDKEIKSILEGH